MATFTVSPDANPETTSVDGYVQRSASNETISGIVGGSGTARSNGGALLAALLGAGTTTDRYAQVRHTILLFDSSGLPDGAFITSAQVRAHGLSATSGLGALEVGVYESSPASDIALVNADYSTLDFSTRLDSSSITTSNVDTSDWNEFDLNASGLALINDMGVTRLGLALVACADEDDGLVTWASGATSQANFESADNGSGRAPELVVEYELFAQTYEVVIQTLNMPESSPSARGVSRVVGEALNVAQSALEAIGLMRIVDEGMEVSESLWRKMVTMVNEGLRMSEPLVLSVFRLLGRRIGANLRSNRVVQATIRGARRMHATIFNPRDT
jgi:hypothetical protein